MQSHSESINTSKSGKSNYSSSTARPQSHTWLHGDDTEQLLSSLPAQEQRIVHSFLSQLADKEKLKSAGESGRKFFDPMAGP